MNDFRILPRALADLTDIGRYTQGQWGKQQRDSCLRELDSRFQWLADNPKLGKHRPDVKHGYYCYQQNSHIVFYLIREGGVDIIGIPHKVMDVGDYFPR